LWAHLYDPHRPYDAPEPFGTSYAHNPYVGEIAYADAQIGRLLGVLERRGWLDRTLVIVVADHGESLGAHGERDHGIFIYEDVLRVPLIVRAPGLRPGRVGEVVRVTDVMPTVLDVVGVPAPPADGVSLADLMHGRRSGLDLEAYAESLYPERFGWSALRSIRHGRLKLIQAPRPELYDLWDDPFETRNIYSDRGASVEALSARLAMVEPGSDQGRAASRADAPAAVQARLAALGYVSSGAAREAAATPSRVDPKDCVGLMAAGPIMAAAKGPCGPMLPVVPDRPER
jgi:arylsulfatase A-like enzyme